MAIFYHIRASFIAAVIMLLCMLPAPTVSARGYSRKLDDLARSAQFAAIVHCTSAHSVTLKEKGGLIFTEYQFNRQEQLIGDNLPVKFTLRVVGGTTGRYRVVVPDAPHFETGQDYVVLLRLKTIDHSLLVAGASRGVLPARRVANSWEISVPVPTSTTSENKVSPQQRAERFQWIGVNQFRQILTAERGRQ